jgi:hypothetical protein
MKHVIVLAFLASVVSCAGSGTETDNPAAPLKDFSSSACKNHETSPAQQALVRESDAEGLTCVEWARGSEGELDLKLRNFSKPCAESYLGKASFDGDGELQVSVYQDTCAVAKCGMCVFDFHYQLQNVTADEPLRLRIGSAVCESQPTTFADELTLPIDTEESGVVCRSLDRSGLEWYARGRSVCGSANMPCGATCDGADQTTCGAGLTCTELAGNDSRCLTDCTTDDDCPSGLTTCLDGVCQAASSWP